MELKAEDFIIDVNICQSGFRVKTSQSQRTLYTIVKIGDNASIHCKVKKQNHRAACCQSCSAQGSESSELPPGQVCCGWEGLGAEASGSFTGLSFGQFCSQ